MKDQIFFLNEMKMKVCRVVTLLRHISPVYFTWRKQMNATNTRGSSSPVIKLVTEKTSSLLRHDSSEHFPSLDCLCDPDDSQRFPTFDIPSCGTWFKLRWWCIDWWWQVFRITKCLNKHIHNKKCLLCSQGHSPLHFRDQHVVA